MPPLAALSFDNVDRPWLWAVLVVVAVGTLIYAYREIFQRNLSQLTWGLLALRGAGVLALILALAHPAWERVTQQVDQGRLAVVVDDSVSMSLADSGGRPRYALARDAVRQLRDALANGSGPAVSLDLFDVHGNPRDELPSEPRAERTDLVQAVSSALKRMRSRPLAGIVVISDGMDNSGRESLEELRDSPTPIYAIGFAAGDAAGRMDLAVTRVAAPQRVMVNNTLRVDVTVTKSGGPAVEAVVSLRRGQTEFASQSVSLAEGNQEQRLSLDLTPREAGQFEFTAHVASPAGELMLANNFRRFPLLVDARPIRVLYVEGFLREEFKFLKARLEDDPDVSLVTLVRRAHPSTAPAGGGGLITPQRLAGFDLLILGDMESSYLAEAEHQAIAAWLDGEVDESQPAATGETTDPENAAARATAGEKPAGRSLLVLGGYQSFGPDGLRKTVLAGALPVVFSDEDPLQSEDPFILQLTEQGQSHAIFNVTGDRIRDAAIWSAAPPLLGMPLVAREKPGADVLARNESALVGGAPAPVIVTQRYGAGRTMVVAADTTWRWSRLARVQGQPDTLYARFWSQTVRYLAGREQEQQRARLVVSTDRLSYDVGKLVAIRVVRQLGPGETTGGAEISVELADESGKSSAVEVRSTTAEPDTFRGTVYPATSGRYTVMASLQEDGKKSANGSAEFIVQGSDLELSSPGTNRARLQSLATMTGGLYVDVADASTLAPKIERRERRTLEVKRTELGTTVGSPWLFLFFLAAVTAEWIIRRRNHLV